VQTTLFGSRTHEKKDFYDNPKNNYKIFANEIDNEMSGNASRADVKHEIDRRWKTFLLDKLVPTETFCSHTEKASFDYGFKVLTKRADINNSVPSTSKPMKSFSKDPNNNEILYNLSINYNISALLKNFIIDEWSSLVFE
jgi:hypothetical protein